RPSDPRACVRVQPAGGRRSGGAGPRGAPGPPGGARELRDGGRRLPAAGGRGPLFERPAGAGRAQAHVSARGAPPPAARHQSRVRDAASSGVHPQSGGDQAGQLSPGSRRPVDLRELPRAEREYWEAVIQRTGFLADTLRFLALSLDENGRPIPIVNTDPAMLLLLEPVGLDRTLELAGPIMQPYLWGLFVDDLGPLVA